jgi:hypothetical protein
MRQINQSSAKLEETAKPALRAQEEEEEVPKEAVAAMRREKGRARIGAAEERLRGVEATVYEATVRVVEAKDRHRKAEAEWRVALGEKQRLQQEAISLRNAIQTMKAHMR